MPDHRGRDGTGCQQKDLHTKDPHQDKSTQDRQNIAKTCTTSS